MTAKFALERRGRELGLEPKEATEDVLRIEEIPDEGMLLHVRRPADWLDVGVPVEGDLEGWVLLFKIGPEVTVHVEGAATQKLECSRCLKEVTHPVTLDYRSMYLPAKDEELEEETELVEEDLGVVFYRKPEIPLADLFREELILAVPLKPLCSEDCPGLCPSCGAELAGAGCTCAKPAPDPRFSALSGLLESMKKQGGGGKS